MPRPIDVDLFRSPQRKSSVDLVIDKIKELLLSHRLVPGDRLPNEMELTRSLSASRGTIREAMKVLASYGIVEIRRGDGTYVSQSLSGALFEPLLFQLILSKTDKRKLMELRELIEVGMVKLLVRHVSDEDIAEIEARHSDMQTLVESGERDPKTLARSDLAFHFALAHGVKNELVEKIYEFTLELFSPSIEETHRQQDRGILALRLHKNIVEGIRTRDEELTRKAVLESIEQWVTHSSE